MEPASLPLRILAIVNLPWDSRLGAARVWIELTKEWTRAGHIVEKFCLTDAFPAPAASSAVSALRQVRFPQRAAAFVRKNGDRFDVIDCLVGVLPFSKSSLRFRGLLVTRSVGLYRLYDRFLRQADALWPEKPKGRWFGRLFHRFVQWRGWRDSERSVRVCDLLNVPNEDEERELEQAAEVTAPAVVEPYGLSDDFRAALEAAARPAAERFAKPKICFIGMWGARKGSRDWPRIIAALRQRYPAVEFLFLGTMFEEKVVRAELGAGNGPGVTCLSTFAGADLPSLLSDCTLALFPSYIEGFGLAVLEQLAAGLPTVAYDVPGPRQILQSERERLLTPVGDPIAIAARAGEILALSLPDYEALSAASREIARRYRWSQIAHDTIERYRTALQSLGQEPISSARE